MNAASISMPTDLAVRNEALDSFDASRHVVAGPNEASNPFAQGQHECFGSSCCTN